MSLVNLAPTEEFLKSESLKLRNMAIGLGLLIFGSLLQAIAAWL